MIDITGKFETLRQATAQSVITMKNETLERLKKNDLPKKDPLIVARIAGVMAAKKTPELIPYCHSLVLDHVDVDFELGHGQVVVRVTVQTISKTGVEMEALTAASVVALTLYDMLKPVDKEMEIIQTRLLAKTGGKTDFQERISKNFRAAVIVTSDGTAKGQREDKSGRIIQEKLRACQIENIDYVILPDEQDQIYKQILKYCEDGVDLVITTGGTGLGPRDVTVEATAQLIERETPAIMQAIRQFGQKRTPYSMLSRGLAGVRGKTIIINLPGSSKGAAESMDAIFPPVLHIFKMMRGGGH